MISIDNIWGTTTSATDDDRGTLTFDKLMAAMDEIKRPAVFYMASDHVPIDADGKILCIQNQNATPTGYDIVCHTSQVAELISILSEEFIVRPMDDTERMRRFRSFSLKVNF